MKIIKTLKSLKQFTTKKKNNNKKIILCHGVFDILHVGHIKYFNEAKTYGDLLIVSITSDKYVNKGKGRPVFNENYRSEVIAALKIVDAVYLNNNPTAVELISSIKPDIYFKGPDYKNAKKDKTGNIIKEIDATKKYGGKINYSNDITFSSSNLINNHYSVLNQKQKKFVNNIINKYKFDYIYKKINSFKDLKILLVGETIIDEYIFGDVLGKSGKEPHLVIKENKNEQYLGGAAAIAGHLSSFCKSLDFISLIGKDRESLKYVKKKLNHKINVSFFYKDNSPTILKKRFIDNVSKQKILGVYKINDQSPDKNFNKRLQNKIKQKSKNADIVIVSDYGHGFISDSTAKILTSLKNMLSLNAQINASNYSYYSLRKYKNINILIINENELRFEMRDKDANVEHLAKMLKQLFKIKTLIVTRGDQGSLMIRKNSITYCPAFANKVVDKIGAGDTMLSIISLCIKNKVPDDLTLFLGSIAGAFSVENIANSKFLDKNKMLREIEFILK